MSLTGQIYPFLVEETRLKSGAIWTMKGNVHTPEGPSAQKSFLWVTIHFDWQCMCLHMNGQPVTLPMTVTIPLKDKIRACHMLSKEDIDLQFLIKQSSNWYSLNKSVHTQY